jgi:hypothetical protein
MATVRVPKTAGPEITVTIGPGGTATVYKVGADGTVSCPDEVAAVLVTVIEGAARAADAPTAAPAAAPSTAA